MLFCYLFGIHPVFGIMCLVWLVTRDDLRSTWYLRYPSWRDPGSGYDTYFPLRTSNEIFRLNLIWYFSTLVYFQIYITQRRREVKMSGSQPPSKIFDKTANIYTSSTMKKNNGKHKTKSSSSGISVLLWL